MVGSFRTTTWQVSSVTAVDVAIAAFVAGFTADFVAIAGGGRFMFVEDLVMEDGT